MLVAGLIGVSTAYGKVCPPYQAEAADAMLDHLDTWSAVDIAVRKFHQCDDGSIAEGYSEAVARLLVDHWQTLPQLSTLIKRHPPLKDFVLRHIDTTLDTDDLEKIKTLSSSSCPRNTASLCKAIEAAAAHAYPN